MAFKMRNPFLQEKTKQDGPAVKKCKGDLIYHAESDTCMTVEQYEDAMGVGKGSNRKVMKSDKATEEKLKEIEKKKSQMSAEEIAELQRIADDKADKFHKRGKYAVKKKK